MPAPILLLITAVAEICLLKVAQVEPARKYLEKALTERSDFAPALLSMAGLLIGETDYENAKIYLDRYHLVARPGPRSLSYSIRTALEIDPNTDVSELVQRLGTDYPDSEEYQLWKAFE